MSLYISPIRISTITASGNVGAIPDMLKLYNSDIFIPYWWLGEGIIKIETEIEGCHLEKGICMETILHTTTKTKKRFYNQSSFVFRLSMFPTFSSEPNTFKEVNMKLFKNGGFQMTGISSEEMGKTAMERLLTYTKHSDIWSTPPFLKLYKVCMINSDYTIGKSIRRDRLYHILVEKYGLWSSFEPTIYQGVNTKFFWNKTRPAGNPPGICACPIPCTGEGDGYAVGECKKITISPFRTGSIIITGGKHIEQIMDAYHFMNSVFLENDQYLLRDEVSPPPKKKQTTPPKTTEEILKQKMRASPRNIVRISAVKT
jgi:TATA-box binding protein (TBP) (component of TFIID and TFIIIB)